MKLLFRLALLVLLFAGKQTLGQDGYVAGKPALAYWKVGKATENELVIALHGGPGVAHQYLRPEWDQLSQVAQVIYYDQRGCGKSEKGDCYIWTKQVEDLKRVVNTFAKGRKVVLAGSSWGTLLALVYAYTFPEDVKGLILSGTVGWRSWHRENDQAQDCAYYEALRKEHEKSSKKLEFQQLTDSLSPGQRPATQAAVQSEAEQHGKILESVPPEVFRQMYDDVYTSLAKEGPTLTDLKKLSMPVLLFKYDSNCGSDPSSIYASVLPHVDVQRVPGGCHDPWLTNPGTFFGICHTFIKKLKQK